MRYPERFLPPSWLSLSRCYLLVLAAFLAACGGGGGGDGGDDDFFNVLAFYDFAITNPAGAPAAVTKTVIAPGQPNDVYTINAGTGSIRGRYFTSDGDMTIADTTSYTVTWSGGGPTPAEFSVAFTAEGSFPSNQNLPVSGNFAVTWGADTITVEYNFSDVALALNGGAPQTFTKSNFIVLDLPGVVATDWQRVAARASRALTDTLVQARGVPVFLERVNDGELDPGQSVTACDPIPGTAPGGVMQNGTVVAQELSGGDRYLSTFNDCFIPSALVMNTGFLATGTIDRVNLLTTVDGGGQGGSLLEFGFVAPGGVTFDTRLQVMTENMADVWNFDGNETLVTGGFAIQFTYPPS